MHQCVTFDLQKCTNFYWLLISLWDMFNLFQIHSDFQKESGFRLDQILMRNNMNSFDFMASYSLLTIMYVMKVSTGSIMLKN